ncbi:PEP-CTERM sorting domain-containing protein [Aquabacterium fontiphilum]|jgi:hypothetical protein|uniref:FxDxF family PEP-CTERM protein n=1 Tax=Aquabacterium fontiphilum TaxID=450365 RepID=UPI0013783584|nr:FxDxF family PEP-CTERM protein [Aquabacterium fontiphilum]NBD20644.1 PEP-CTERM sorting domain-containing protein [Aquabacterium fontiphilum]
MKLRHIVLAAATALSAHVAHALPSNGTYLGIDPFTEPFAGGTSLFVEGGMTSTFTFDLSTLSDLFGKLKQIQNDVTVTKISLSGGSLAIPALITLPASNTGTFSFTNLSAGQYSLAITATTTSVVAMYSGAISVTPVPEAETYALALAGLGVVGLVAARRKRVH